MGRFPSVILLAVAGLLFLENVISETTDVCSGYDCLENAVCPPDSYIDDDYYDDNVVFDIEEVHRSKRQVPPRFQLTSTESLFDKCCDIDNICKCSRCHKLPKCGNTTFIPIRIKVAAKAPGDCCDTYECQPIPKCSEEPKAVWRTECKDCRCMFGETLCSVVEHCEFQPEEQPASCHSSELNRIFEHGDEWTESDDCMDCQCKDGERKCIRTDCKVPECANPVKIPGQCCKVCPEVPSTEKATTEGPSHCFSTAIQKIFNHGAEWKEADDCMDCRCENGDIKCQSSFCKPLDCENAVKIPGQCCKVCVDTIPPSIQDDDDNDLPADNMFFRHDMLYIYAYGLLPIIVISVICFFCCRRNPNFVGRTVERLSCCCRQRQFVATTNLRDNKYSTIQQSESTVTTAPSTPTLR
ncbi:hypothetical protein ACFFRR_011011 [Megaselia abdita]